MTTLSILMDNEALPGLNAEWGLSMALELDDGSLWLWDSGASAALTENAARMGVDLSSARGLALSHGHWDHTGGLEALARAGFRGPTFMHPDGLLPRYRKDGGTSEAIGIRSELPDIVPVTGPIGLAPGLTMLADIPREPGCAQAIRNFFLDAETTLPDPVRDDAALVVQSADGRVAVVLGCCHGGLMNTLDHARKVLRIDQVDTVAGGLHLYDADPETALQTVEALELFGVRRVLAGHCTGQKGLAGLRQRFGGAVEQTRSGMRFDLFTAPA